MTQKTLRRIGRILARHEREDERLKAGYAANGARIDTVVALGVPLDQPIALPDGREVVVQDQFANRNIAFKSACVPRYVVKAYRADRSNLPKRPRRGSTSDQPQPEGIEQI